MNHTDTGWTEAHQANSEPDFYGKWVSVSDSLPPESQTVLAITDRNDIYTCRVSVINANLNAEESNVGRRVRYTHWMPLPEPPIPT